jgi:hypothetical protein
MTPEAFEMMLRMSEAIALKHLAGPRMYLVRAAVSANQSSLESVVMNDDLNRWIAAYRGMDEWGKQHVLTLAEVQAQKHPARNVSRLWVVVDNVAAESGSAPKPMVGTRGLLRRYSQRRSRVYTRVPPALQVVK